MADGNSARVQQQADFLQALCRLVTWAGAYGYTLTLGEAERPKELAELYAKTGRGITDSQHRKRLAVDLHLYVGGVYQDSTEAHARIGDQWEKLDRRARWGGRFPRPDGNHYEFIDP